tara:strand:- start:720 stop:1562 length:843 start_codon:yes stop_codon:yes gene_type:complete
MSIDQLLVKKQTLEMEPYSEDKFKASIISCGVDSVQAARIVDLLKPQLYNGISTVEIHKKAYSFLKKHDSIFASKYILKRAIFELGPTGYPFERLISALLKKKGYSTKVSVVLNGKCVTHEIDVLAEKDGVAYVVECKFHTDSKAVSNVKIPLYINSRFLDVQEQWNTDPLHKTYLKQGWLVTNTRFTQDAIDYARCVGLTLLSWDYPKNNGIKANIDSYGLFPISTLTRLTKKEKQQLIAKDIILVDELLQAPCHLIDIVLEDDKIKHVMEEIDRLCNI